MNALASIDGKALAPLSVDEARKPLAILFAAYPEPWTDKGASHAQALIEAKVSAYLLALQGLPAWAIETAVKDYIQGRVERRRRDKLPTAEEIAALSREHVGKEAARQMVERARREQLAESQAWAEKQKWLQTPEGQEHQRQRAERAAAILRTAGQTIPEA
ncbi:MAG: hypothetical protein E5X86_19770 [Mesorhizobium sp.]|uniref:hypothetical protein n=1 Tax=Mesorhizobium sp. TaxID=1871066 RepID=UPI001211D3F2|nr:hypothetical protein [Mesorhizobium sp.]TIO15610.1 MAG: hypothetical protein E5X86_19770 [Mesorhizobium sp.]